MCVVFVGLDLLWEWLVSVSSVLELVLKKLEFHSSVPLGTTHTHYFLRTVKCHYGLVKKVRNIELLSSDTQAHHFF